MYKLCVVEDNPVTAEAISEIINSTNGYELAGIYYKAEDYIEDFSFVRPDITLMDIDLPGISGIEAVVKIKKLYPAAKIIMLTNHDSKEKLFEALKAGADGYLLKKDTMEKLSIVLKELEEGSVAITPAIGKKIVEYFSKTNIAVKDLTEKEKNVLTYIVDGLLYKEIADKMNLSIDSIKKYVSSIYAKLHVRSRSEAIKKYLT